MPDTEYVLCINKSSLPDKWVEEKSVLPMPRQTFLETCTAAGFDFVLRQDAESDPTLKQVIPYIVIQTMDGAETAMYSRAGSEKRLHDLKSIGIGGHINPEDQHRPDKNFSSILTAGMQRELDEELSRFPSADIPQFAGIISEDVTDVGKVHLGAVFQMLTQTPSDYVPGEELFEFQWVKTESLKDYDLELWSELALELLEKS